MTLLSPDELRARAEKYREWWSRLPPGDDRHAALADLDAALAHIAAQAETVRRLEEALRFQDPRNAAVRYDQIADDFERKTGLWPPGRSRAAAMGPDPDAEHAARVWRAFCNKWHEEWFDRALSPSGPKEGRGDGNG